MKSSIPMSLDSNECRTSSRRGGRWSASPIPSRQSYADTKLPPGHRAISIPCSLEHFHLRYIVDSAVTEPGLGVLWCDLGKELRDGLIERLGGAGLGGAEQLFQLGPGLLDRIQVRRIRRQVEQFRSRSLDQLLDP